MGRSLSGESRATSSSRLSWPSARNRATAASMPAGVPQHDGVEVQAERDELVLLAVAARLANLAPAAVTDRAGGAVTGLLNGELPVRQPPVQHGPGTTAATL